MPSPTSPLTDTYLRSPPLHVIPVVRHAYRSPGVLRLQAYSVAGANSGCEHALVWERIRRPAH